MAILICCDNHLLSLIRPICQESVPGKSPASPRPPPPVHQLSGAWLLEPVMMFTQILLQRHEDQRAHQQPPRSPRRLQLLSSVWGPALSSQAGFPTTCRNPQIRQPAPSHLLNPCYSKWGPQTNSNSITWELVRHTLQTYWMTSGILTRSQVIPMHVTV